MTQPAAIAPSQAGTRRASYRPRGDHGGQAGHPAGARSPSLFIGGALDASTTWLADAIEAYPTTLPGLVSSHILDGCGHWIQQERREQANEIMTGWLASLPD